MPFVIKGKRRHKIRFVSSAELPSAASSVTSTSTTSTTSRASRVSYHKASSNRRRELSQTYESQREPSASYQAGSTEVIDSETTPREQTSNMATAGVEFPFIPSVFTSPPPIEDDLITETSTAQLEVMETCLPYLNGDFGSGLRLNAHGVPPLEREKHIKFLLKFLGPLPGGYAAADAARPWFFYWCLNALAMLGAQDEIASLRDALIATVRPLQNPTGGFAGGHGQMSHVAVTYAIVLSLAIVGGEEAFEVIDRRAMWEWLCVLKQPDGGFQVAVGGEEDIRGAYCCAVVISLLGLPLNLSPESPGRVSEDDTLLTRLPDYVSRCQTYEGGISGCPDAEAHGAYAFCALGCLSVLGEPQKLISKYLDIPRLVSWLSSRQYGPEGGFSGRTNKLVDGCYSHWVGGCWHLIEAALNASIETNAPSVLSLYSREGLIRYILCCCQETRKGGLRDKPGKSPDAYHTCYVLEGLSSAQHQWTFDYERLGSTSGSTDPDIDLDAAYNWTSGKYEKELQIFDERDRVNTSHPVFAIPEGCAERMRDYFYNEAQA